MRALDVRRKMRSLNENENVFRQLISCDINQIFRFVRMGVQMRSKFVFMVEFGKQEVDKIRCTARHEIYIIICRWVQESLVDARIKFPFHDHICDHFYFFLIIHKIEKNHTCIRFHNFFTTSSQLHSISKQTLLPLQSY